MFDFFEGVIEKLGVKLIDGFSSKLVDFITDIKKSSKGELNDKGGDSAKIGSSGYSAQIGSSGDSAKIGSSGDSAKIGSSGDYAKIGSSGYYAKIGSSGNYAQIGSSGDSAKIGSSGYYAQIDIQGEHSVGFACGLESIVKAVKGTWISLCEYEKVNDEYIPVFALSAQIGNKEYKDFRGRILKENEYYCLSNRKFYPVDISDGIKIKKISEKKKDNMIIIKGTEMDDNEEMYLVKEGELSAHGKTLREAIEDLTFKKMKSEEVQNIIAEIKKTGKVNKAQYRAITGACQYGTNKFCEQHNITAEEIELSELRKILIDDYGAKKFWELVGD